jgi:hypothetical protein
METLKKVDLVRFPFQAVMVAYASYCRLFWKGYPPEMPDQLTDNEGNLWHSTPNFKDKTVTLTKRHTPFSVLGQKCTVYILDENSLANVTLSV